MKSQNMSGSWKEKDKYRKRKIVHQKIIYHLTTSHEKESALQKLKIRRIKKDGLFEVQIKSTKLTARSWGQNTEMMTLLLQKLHICTLRWVAGFLFWVWMKFGKSNGSLETRS